VPATKAPEAAPVTLGDNVIIDRKSGKPGNKLPDPPMRGPIGGFIYDHFTQDTWREWIAMGTKVINELRLDLSRDEHAKAYEDHMLEWLGFTREEAAAHAKQAGVTTGAK
jgi:Fe-S cluster biosynthesis and repair protein YggX